MVVQGTVDGLPVLTSMYGGGRDFSYLRRLFHPQGFPAAQAADQARLGKILAAADCFVLPGLDPQNLGTGPFPALRGRIEGAAGWLLEGESALILANLCTALTAAVQLGLICPDPAAPVLLTGGGARDPYLGRLLATVTGRQVFVLRDRRGKLLSETTTLGAGLAGKAACLGVHPNALALESLGLSCRELEPFGPGIAALLAAYREKFMALIEAGDRA